MRMSGTNVAIFMQCCTGAESIMAEVGTAEAGTVEAGTVEV